MREYQPSLPFKPKRPDELQNTWEQKMPCHDCELKDICRYYNSIKRLDYDPAIFEVSITCKRKVVPPASRPPVSYYEAHDENWKELE